MNILPLTSWFENFSSDPLLIAGPCSAESEEQLLRTAHLLKGTNPPSVFRAGLWKPRTRPGTFNGIGNKGLRWLKRVREETGFRIAVEAATPNHVEACLKSKIDIIWLGARTVSNPFSVEEIAEALRGVDIPVLIKNPLNPDIDLWIGALERINQVGIKKIAAVHRGFSPFENTVYRNMPKWELPIELRRRIKDLPVLCDPSHIAGDYSLVPEIAQKAMDLNMHGLMTEVHFDPASAKSDNLQQLTPELYHDMMHKLVIRQLQVDDPGFLNYLEELRNQVDSVDHQVIELLSRRMEISKMLGEYKCRNNVAVLQMDRWLEILKTRIKHGKSVGLDPGYLEKYLKLLHQESIRIQTDIMQKLKEEGDCSTDDGPGG